MGEKHLTLYDNLQTFPKEDEALDLLTTMGWQLPIFVIATAILDLVLAFVYLKWLHPWKIILQEENDDRAQQTNTLDRSSSNSIQVVEVSTEEKARKVVAETK